LSVSCPGDLVLKTYDLVRVLRDAEVPVIGGFPTRFSEEHTTIIVERVLNDIDEIVHVVRFPG
jgi:hypothetical protein